MWQYLRTPIITECLYVTLCEGIGKEIEPKILICKPVFLKGVGRREGGGGGGGGEGEEESVGALPAVTEKSYKEGFGRSL